MDGFTGFKTAATEELPDVVTVIDPFHVTRLAGEALDACRRRVQQAICGHRGMAGDPLYAARRILHTGADLLTDKQTDRLRSLFADNRHEVRRRGRELTVKLVDSISAGVPKALVEMTKLGRTLRRRSEDVLAYSALGFRNLTNYIARSLLETGGFRPQLSRRS